MRFFQKRAAFSARSFSSAATAVLDSPVDGASPGRHPSQSFDGPPGPQSISASGPKSSVGVTE